MIKIKQIIVDATGWAEVTWMDGETQVDCVSFHPTQLDVLKATAVRYGTDLTEYESLLASWVASYVPEPVVLTLADFQVAHDEYLNSKARERHYDSIHTAALRAGYAGPYQAEGLAYAQWMDQCNVTGYQILAEVQVGTRLAPTSIAEYIALLPELVLP